MEGTPPLSRMLIDAYSSTLYRAELPGGELVLRVNEENPTLSDLFNSLGARSATFITGWNPFSQMLKKKENKALNLRLLERLNEVGATHIFPGQGEDPKGEWKPERSFLALGVTLAMAKTLGVEFQQNAVIWSDADAIPKLVILRGQDGQSV